MILVSRYSQGEAQAKAPCYGAQKCANGVEVDVRHRGVPSRNIGLQRLHRDRQGDSRQCDGRYRGPPRKPQERASEKETERQIKENVGKEIARSGQDVSGSGQVAESHRQIDVSAEAKRIQRSVKNDREHPRRNDGVPVIDVAGHLAITIAIIYAGRDGRGLSRGNYGTSPELSHANSGLVRLVP